MKLLSIRFVALVCCIAMTASILPFRNAVSAAELGKPAAPVLAVVDGGLRWTQPGNGVDVAGHNVHRGDGSYVTTVSGADRWDPSGATGDYFVTAFDGTPGGAQISDRSNTVSVTASAGDAGSTVPALPDGFSCGNWPPRASSQTRTPVTADAQDAATDQCGVAFNDQNGDRCDWMSNPDGWRCLVHVASGSDSGSSPTDAPPTTPNNPAPPAVDEPGLPDGFVCGNWPPVASNDSRSPVTSDAQDAASDQCGEAFDDQDGDRCDWMSSPDGWRCLIRGTDSGNSDSTGGDATPDEPGLPDGFVCGNWPPVASNDSRSPVTSDAQDAAAAKCGVEYNDQNGDRCDWINAPAGWRCLIKGADDSVGTDPGAGPGNGPGNGPGTGGDESARDTTQAPPMPTDVRIRQGRVEWQMPPGPRFVYQLTTNNSKINDGQPWTQREVQAASSLTFQTLPDGNTRFSYPVGGFAAGTTFRVEAIHPYDIAVTGNRGSSSRFATVAPTNPGGEIDDFLSTFNGSGDSSIGGAWIGDRSQWSSTPQFVDDFGGSSLSNKWYAADGQITPAYSRDKTFTRDTARVRDGKLVMTVDTNTNAYSYLGTGDDQGNGYHIDASSGAFVEASVRLDKAAPADNAWWAFWLMNPDGGAYDGNANTGSEVDLFELVPDQNNGFNAALYRGKSSAPCGSAGQLSVSRTPETGDCFTYNTPNDIAGVNVPNYMDGNYHRIGMYYSHDKYAFYIDDTLIWEVDEPGFITAAEELSIRLTWELQNTNNPWTPGFGGNTKSSARDDDPTVYVDWVKVWEKTDGSTTPDDPDPDPDPDPLVTPEAPARVNYLTATTPRYEGGVKLSWIPDSTFGRPTPSGYIVQRDGANLVTVTEPAYNDTNVVAGRTYTYSVTAFTGPDDSRNLGPSATATVTATAPETAAAPPAAFELTGSYGSSSTAVHLLWKAPPGYNDGKVSGYAIMRDGVEIAVSNEINFGFLTPHYFRGYNDTAPVPGATSTYTVVAFLNRPEGRLSGPPSNSVSVTVPAPPPPPTPPPATHQPTPTDPKFARAIDVLLPNVDVEMRRRLSAAFWNAHQVAVGGRTYAYEPWNVRMSSDLDDLIGMFNEVGIETPYSSVTVHALFGERQLTERFGETAHSIAAQSAEISILGVVPAYPVRGTPPSLGELAPGWTRQARADRFAANIPILNERLLTPPKRGSEAERTEILAFEQAKMLLDIEPGKRSRLWAVADAVADGMPKTQRVYDPNRRDEDPVEYVHTKFALLWNSATKMERLEYYGFDETGWELALPYIELSAQMDDIQDDLEDWVTPVIKLIVGVVIGIATAGAATAAYAAYFNVAATTFGATTAGAVAGAYATTFFITGSTAASEKAAWSALFSAGLTHYAKIPAADRTTFQVFSVAVLEGGIASLSGKKFKDAFLASLGEHYIPGMGDYLENLDNISPFLADLGEVLVRSYIENGNDWNKISDDLEQFGLDYAGAHVADYVGGALGEKWGSFGEGIGVLAGVAVATRGDETKIRGALTELLKGPLGNTVGDLFGDSDSILEDIVVHLTETMAEAVIMDEEDLAGFVDREMRKFIFERAGDTLSGALANRLAGPDGELSGLQQGMVGLLDVVVTNAWKEPAALEADVRNFVTATLQQQISSAFPDCAPAWLTGLADQLIGVALDTAISGDPDDIGANLADLVNQTSQSGQIPGIEEGFGTCGDAAEDGDGGGDGDCGPSDTATASSSASSSGGGGGVLSRSIMPTGTIIVSSVHGVLRQTTEPERCDIDEKIVAFQRWLDGLSALEITTAFDVEERGVTVRLFPRDPEYAPFSVVANTQGEEIGLIHGPTKLQPLGDGNTGARIGVQRDARGDIVDFYFNDDYLELYEATSAADRSIVDELIAFGGGCRSSITGFFEQIRSALVELWQADSVGAYLRTKWGEFQVIVEAFRHNPAQFFEDFLKDLIQLDEFEADRTRWFGIMTCDILLAAVTAGVGTAAFKFARVFVKADNGDIARWLRTTDPDERSEIGVACALNSFPTGTPVLMADGSYLPIELVTPGDLVLAADPTTGVWSSQRVRNQWSHLDHGEMATVTLSDGSQVTATDHHQFWVANDGAWVELEDVQPGDFLLTPDGVALVSTVELTNPRETLVWELDVAVVDTFAVSSGMQDVLVHNVDKKCRPSFVDIDAMIDRYDLPESRDDVIGAWTVYDGPLDGDGAVALWLSRYGNIRRNWRNGNVHEVDALRRADVPGRKLMFTTSRGKDFIADDTEWVGDDIYFVEAKNYDRTELDTTTNVGTMLEYLLEQPISAKRGLGLYIGNDTVITPRLYALIDEAENAGVQIDIVRAVLR